jgi:hypothetical protein
MAGNNGRERLVQVALPVTQPTPVAQLTITAYDNQPPVLHCSGNIVTALRLLGTAAAMIATSLEERKSQLPAEDKPRQFLGPRKG